MYSMSPFYSEELLLGYILGQEIGKQQFFNTINSYAYARYKTRAFKKSERRVNILLPTYSYLEYQENGFLEFYEDFVQGLTIELV